MLLVSTCLIGLVSPKSRHRPYYICSQNFAPLHWSHFIRPLELPPCSIVFTLSSWTSIAVSTPVSRSLPRCTFFLDFDASQLSCSARGHLFNFLYCCMSNYYCYFCSFAGPSNFLDFYSFPENNADRCRFHFASAGYCCFSFLKMNLHSDHRFGK